MTNAPFVIRTSSFIRYSGFVILVSLALATSAKAANWTWYLPAERYKTLNTFERAQYDKAADLVNKQQFAAAANEFEKFNVQFTDSPALPYSIFMRAYCLHYAKNRNQAIKVYQEVLDYFPDNVEEATAALFHMGLAHIDNGDTLKGLQCMKTLVEHPNYGKHPLAAGALRRLAENHWNNREPQLAVKYWRQVVTDFGEVNQTERDAAVSGLAQVAVIDKDYASFETFLATDDPKKRDDPAFRKAIVETLWYRAWSMHTYGFDRKRTTNPKDIDAERAAFYAWYKTTKPRYDATKETFAFYDRSLTFLAGFLPKEKDERNRLIDEAVALAKTTQGADKAAGDAQLSRMADLLSGAKVYDRAKYVAQQISDKLAGAYKEYEITASEAYTTDAKLWAEAEKQLMAIEAGPSPEWKTKAMAERARVYKDVLARYDDAIKLYQQLNAPPGTLWSIAECYQRSARLKEALGILTEIENSFADNAARAAWTKAAWLDGAGEQAQAVTYAKRVLKLHPKSPESSSAHQLLEKYGIATGGGLTEE